MVPTYGEYQVIPFADQVTDNIIKRFLSLSVPIFNGFQVKNSIEQAKVGVLQSVYAKESTQQVLRTSIESAWADAIAAQKTLNAQNAALSAAELAFANTELQFEAGLFLRLNTLMLETDLISPELTHFVPSTTLCLNLKSLTSIKGEQLHLDNFKSDV